jgi:hypothetical protein
LLQEQPVAVSQAIGRHVVEAVIQSDLPRVEPPQGGQEWAANVLVVADDLPEDAPGPNGRRVEVGDDGDALSAGPEEEGGVPHHAGADDQLDARVGVQFRLAHEGQPAVEPGLRQQRLGLVGLLVQQHVHPSPVRS